MRISQASASASPAPAAGIVAALLDHAPQCRGQPVRQRVARLRPVERNERDTVPDFAQQLAGSGIDLDSIFRHSNGSFRANHCVSMMRIIS